MKPMYKTSFALAALATLSLSPLASAQKSETAPLASAAAAAAATAETADAAANADTAADADQSATKSTTIDSETARRNVSVSGYLQPQFGVRYRPGAVPRDRSDYSAEQTRAGAIIAGKPLAEVAYEIHVSVAATVLSSDDSQSGSDGETSSLSGLSVERAAVDWDPTAHVGVSVGQMRIPFSVEGQISNTDLMFPNRAAANEIFLNGSDLGALGRLSVRDKKMRVAAGVFNGTTPTTASEAAARGPLFSVRADIEPMGPMQSDGRDRTGGAVRFGFGAGVVYYPSTTYDEAGFAGPRMRDLRGALSVRAAVDRFYFQAEAMHRQRTDSLSSRPLIATGGYGQGSYYVPLKNGMAVSPIARLGYTVEDRSFAPRATFTTEAGATVHISGDKLRADDMQLTLHYLGERRITERESAHGLVAQLKLQW